MKTTNPDLTHLKSSRWSSLECNLSMFYHGSAGSRISADKIPLYVIWRIDSGSVTVTDQNGVATNATPGHWLLIPADFRRSHFFQGEAIIWSAHFWIGWSGHIPLFLLDHVLVRPVLQWTELTRASDELSRLAGPAEDDTLARQLSFQEKKWAWFSAFCQTLMRDGFTPTQPVSHDKRVVQALRILERPVYFTQIPYEQITETTGLGRVQIDRLFMQHLGRSPKQVHEDFLFRQIVQTLLTSDRPLKQIAAGADFRQLTNFCRWFKRCAGISPKEFRQQKNSF